MSVPPSPLRQTSPRSAKLANDGRGNTRARWDKHGCDHASASAANTLSGGPVVSEWRRSSISRSRWSSQALSAAPHPGRSIGARKLSLVVIDLGGVCVVGPRPSPKPRGASGPGDDLTSAVEFGVGGLLA